MERLNLFGKIKEGKLEIFNRQSLNQWLANCNEEDDIVIKFVNQKDYKSLRQLKLAYHCFREISDKTGYEVSEVKMMMKMKQGFCQSHVIDGIEITDCKSISEFSKREMSDFITKMDLWSCQNLNHPLLNSDDIKFLKSL